MFAWNNNYYYSNNKNNNVFFLCFVGLLVISMRFSASYGNMQSDIDNCRPQQVHLSYGSSTADVTVMWATTGQCSTKVDHGTQPFELLEVTPGGSRRFVEPSNRKGAHFIHKVNLRQLPPGQVVYYQPSSNDVKVGPFFFKTPARVSNTSAAEFLTLGDLKSTSTIFGSLASEVAKGKYSAIIQPGNMAMNLSGDDGKNGDLFMKMLEFSAKTVPFMTAPGPAESDNGTFSHYGYRFSMPSNDWPMTVDRMWYSIDIGPVHLISYSTEVFKEGASHGSEQNNWLIKDLRVASENRAHTPWIVAFGHCPMYCSSEDPAKACQKKKSRLEEKLEDIMYHYGVDVIISSTGLANEISYPMYKGVKVGEDFTNPLAPVHVSLASASPWKASHNSSEEEWLYYSDNDKTPLNFGRLRVSNSSHLRYEVVTFSGYKVLESVDIVQQHHGGFSKDNLPANVSARIDEKIEKSGGDPDVPNIEETTNAPAPVNTITKKIKEILQGDNRNKIIIGGSVAGGILVLLVAILVARRVMRGRRRQSSRRWENMDINYGKRYYNKAPEKDDLENDFEIDMTETTAPSRKLLSDD